jgi:hypothetical protein
MVERLLEQFSQYLPLSQEERAAIKASALIRHYPPGKVITMDSCSRQNSFFVLQGLIREYELTPKEEVNLHFYTENDWILNLDSSNPKDSTDEPQRRLVAMEPSDLVVGNEEKAQALFKTSPRLMAVAQKIIEEQAAAYQRKSALTAPRTQSSVFWTFWSKGRIFSSGYPRRISPATSAFVRSL